LLSLLPTQLFIDKVKGVVSWLESCENERKWATVAQHTEMGRNRPQLPGICQDWAWIFIIQVWVNEGQHMLHSETSEWEKGKSKWNPASDRLQGIVCERREPVIKR